MLKQRILGMGKGMAYSLERLVWNGSGGRKKKRHLSHLCQSTTIKYYADGMESNFILPTSGFPPGPTILPKKRLWSYEMIVLTL